MPQLLIASDGTCKVIQDDTALPLMGEGRVRSRRASHVEPASLTLRLAFHALRALFGEKGRVSEFTRSWPVTWRVNMAPSGGPILDETFTDRALALRAEVRWLEHNLFGG